MNFGQAWETAGAILTLLALLPAALIILVMTQNIGNPEYDMKSAFDAGMEAVINAVVPVFGVTIVVALMIYFIANSSRR